MAAAVAVIGLGLMGSRMSANLLAAGFLVRGYDPDPARSAELEGKGGVVTWSPAEAVQGCWAALLSLPTSDVSREVCLGEGGISEAGVAPLEVVALAVVARVDDDMAALARIAVDDLVDQKLQRFQ